MQNISAPRSIALDPTRIASLSGAIAANGLVLLLLLVPMATPVIEQISRGPDVVFVDPKPVPVPVVPPRRQTPVKPTVVPVAQPVRREAAKPDLPPQVVADSLPGDTAAQPPHEAAVVHREEVLPADDGKPMTGAHLQYASAPAPTYPRESLIAEETGIVMLEVLVDVDGRPLEVTISRSSGHRRLDVAAKRQVLSKWRFKPAMRNGQAVQAIGIVPVEFTLN